MTFEWHNFLWHITITVLFVYMCLSVSLYSITRQRLFFYYASYLFLLALFVFDKTEYPFILPSTPLTKNLNWYVQILYHFLYFWFSFEFLRFFQYFPKQKNFLRRLSFAVLGVGSILFLITSLTRNAELFLDYFLYIHVPVTVVIILYLLFKSSQTKEPMNRFYIPGVLCYLILSLVSLYFTFSWPENIVVEPITFFYLAVLAETTMFSSGLGFMINRSFAKSLQTEKDLNSVQAELQTSLQQQLKIAEEEKEFDKLKISSLHSQMNSHFMFNVLNSLKTFIIENDQTTAVNFLNKFAKLMRNYLHGSNVELHSLEDELKTVKLYIDIENQRLNNSIDFELNLDNTGYFSQYQIPVHLLIPFVEFSIWKGLFFKSENKHLEISFKEIQNDLCIEIEDNGHYNGFTSLPNIEQEILNGIELAQKSIVIFNKTRKTQIQLEMAHSVNGGKTSLIFKEMI